MKQHPHRRRAEREGAEGRFEGRRDHGEDRHHLRVSLIPSGAAHERSSTFLTDDACHWPPRAVGIPRAFRASRFGAVLLLPPSERVGSRAAHWPHGHLQRPLRLLWRPCVPGGARVAEGHTTSLSRL